MANDHEYRPFGPDFPFRPATRADELRDEAEHRDMLRQGFPPPAPYVYDPEDFDSPRDEREARRYGGRA